MKKDDEKEKGILICFIWFVIRWVRWIPLEAIRGVYRDGKIELLERPREEREARVIVTFLPPDEETSNGELKLNKEQASDLRARLRTFAEDWERPEMDIYDRP